MISSANLNNKSKLASNRVSAQNHQTTISPPTRVVYVNPIFEIQEGIQLPKTKLELVQLLNSTHKGPKSKASAVPFHYYTCKTCHKIPKYGQWKNIDLHTGKLCKRLSQKFYEIITQIY